MLCQLRPWSGQYRPNQGEEHASCYRTCSHVKNHPSLSIRNGPPRRPGNDVKNFHLVRIRWNGPHQLPSVDLRIWHERPQSVLPLEAYGPRISVAHNDLRRYRTLISETRIYLCVWQMPVLAISPADIRLLSFLAVVPEDAAPRFRT